MYEIKWTSLRRFYLLIIGDPGCILSSGCACECVLVHLCVGGGSFSGVKNVESNAQKDLDVVCDVP